MTVTFGRLGRWFLLAGAAAALALVVAILVLEGTARLATVITLAVLAGTSLGQGVIWTVLQHRWFGSPAALERTARRGVPEAARIVEVRNTSSAIGAEALPVVDLDVDGRRIRRRVRVPFQHAASVRPGTVLPIRADPEGSPVIVVEWDRMP